MAVYALQSVTVNTTILPGDKYDYLFSVDTLNALVMEGMSFRDANVKIGLDIENGKYIPDKNTKHTHIGSIKNPCLEAIEEKLNQF